MRQVESEIGSSKRCCHIKFKFEFVQTEEKVKNAILPGKKCQRHLTYFSFKIRFVIL